MDNYLSSLLPKGIGDAFRQYVRDAFGGSLNAEVKPQDTLDAAALSLTPVPVVGDVAGLLADGYRYATDPSSRTPLNYGLSALGALPFVPAMGGVTKLSKTAPEAPRAKAMEAARKNAVEYLGLPENNTAIDRANALFPLEFNHGTQRLDRLLEKKGIDPKRATSGPMPFGTDSTEMASSYAMGKPDTSRIANDTGDIRNYFQVLPKDMGYRGTAPYSVEQVWHLLPTEKKQEILNKATRVGYEDLDSFTGNFKLHPDGVDATLSRNKWDWDMKNVYRGNPLAALRDMWHDSGQLIDNPEQLADIYKLVGFPYPISQSNAPWTTANGVLAGRARITNPLDTSDFQAMKDKVIPALREAFKRDKTRLRVGADAWDKNSHYTPKEWVNELANDVEAGKNSFVWTSIPDKVTEQLKTLGYNGILDTGGKSGGGGHQVVIPFYPNQVRSRFAAFDPARIHEADLLGAIDPQLLPWLAGSGLLGAYGVSQLEDK